MPPDLLAELGKSEFLLAVGTSYLHKNRSFSLRVFTELRSRGWRGRLVLAGPTPPFGNSLSAEAEILLGVPELRADVIDLGGVAEAQLQWLYENAALVLYPSTVEGFGMVPFEAARCGVPTLCSRRGSLDELLPPGIPTIDDFDVDAAADRAWLLLNDEDAAAQLAAALVACGNNHTWARVAARLLALFGEALKQPRQRVLSMHGDGVVPLINPRTNGAAIPVGARRLDGLVRGVTARPGLKRVLSPNGSRRQQAAQERD